MNGVLLLQASVNFVDAKTRLQIERDLSCRVGCPVVILDDYLRVVGFCEKDTQPCSDVNLPLPSAKEPEEGVKEAVHVYLSGVAAEAKAREVALRSFCDANTDGHY